MSNILRDLPMLYDKAQGLQNILILGLLVAIVVIATTFY